jgi:hypothetical protein
MLARWSNIGVIGSFLAPAGEGGEWRMEKRRLQETMTSHQMQKRSWNGEHALPLLFSPVHPGWYRTLFTSSGTPTVSPIAPVRILLSTPMTSTTAGEAWAAGVDEAK